jgi:hypothetical protein
MMLASGAATGTYTSVQFRLYAAESVGSGEADSTRQSGGRRLQR